jgi:hypothetical protein
MILCIDPVDAWPRHDRLDYEAPGANPDNKRGMERRYGGEAGLFAPEFAPAV